ncbi:hypothetical protein [Pedobacter sp.]|uniref:hypothetical protein n=1 Tax=Pedobacter sp. TaxID=1411316 RepID=UPI003C5C64C3
MSDISALPFFKFEVREGDELVLRVKAVSERSDIENLAVFISRRDDHDNLMYEGLFEVQSLEKAS